MWRLLVVLALCHIRVNTVFWATPRSPARPWPNCRKSSTAIPLFIYRGRLESGMGLASNNVLHARAAFSDDATHKRHDYRARYFDRLAGTDMADIYAL